MHRSAPADKAAKRFLGVTLGLCLLIGMVVWLSGCGIKKPPKPPLHIPPPLIKDLKATLAQNQVALRWSVKRTTEELIFDYEGFVVYRARISLAEAECAKCPLLFIKLAVLPAPLPERRFDERLFVEFTDEIAPGYRYVYKVVGYTTRGEPTQDSNLVVIENP
jgi:hypothetical protein